MIRTLVTSPLGFLVGLSIGALGSGGSILAVPVLVHAAGQSPQLATFTSLIVVGLACAFGLPAHYRAGRVKVFSGVAFGLTGIGGSFAGTALSQRLEPNVLLLAFSGLILLAAWRMMTACPTCTRSGQEIALEAGGGEGSAISLTAGRLLLLVAAGTGVGFLTGLFGVGGGFIVVPMLTLLLHYAMPQAIGTSLLVVAINTVVALAACLGAAEVDWTLTAAFAITAIAGVLAGGRIADRIDAERSLRFFSAALVLLALFTGGSALAALL